MKKPTRKVAVAAAIYAVLLIASTVVRFEQRNAKAKAASSTVPTVTVLAVDGTERLPTQTVQLAVRHWPRDTAGGERSEPEPSTDATTTVPSPPPVILLHGSPGSGSNFARVAPHIATDRDVFALDLPGFGRSDRRVPDYSIRAHADYLLQWLDLRGIEHAHIVGFSMGGGVALHLADGHPKRVASLTLMASIGVQELELLGDYTLNHLVHGAQLWGLRVLGIASPLLPHFGLLDDGMLSVEYARNFYDSDQRPLRAMLERWQGPMLVLHGRGDPLVPEAAAHEHARIVPQSELVLRDDSHFFVFTAPRETAETIAEYLRRVDRGEALTRNEAAADRVAAAGEPFRRGEIVPFTGPALLVVLLLIALATFVSEDLTCIGAGVLAAQGRIPLLAAIGACYVGIVVGDLLLFWLGRHFGRPAVRRAPLRWWIDETAITQSSRWLRKRGAVVVLISRFLPGARLPTNVAAGVLRTHAWKFLFYFAVAGLLWTPPVVWLSAKLGAELLPQLEGLRAKLLIAALLLALFMWICRRFIVPLATHRGRRRMVGRFQRLRHWEFWPWWVTYAPVVVHVLRLGVRHRSLLLFTATNPAMPAGGFVGESKSAILQAIDQRHVPSWRRLEAVRNADSITIDSLCAAVERFRQDFDLAYPVVLKPDRGERGSGVEVAHDAAAVREYFEELVSTREGRAMPTIVQQWVAGLEFGIFWSKGPDDEEGRILSINEKRRPVLTGDGKRSLLDLVLDDERAVALVDTYLRENPDAASMVPAAGEEVTLVEVGAHHRGTEFVDARHHETPELLAAVAHIAESYEGFDFGRLDIKVPSVDDFRRGRNLRVLEINGVTSEVAHVYDRTFRLREARRDLRRQWEECFRIGAQRRAAGQPAWSLTAFARLILRGRPAETSS